MRASPLEIALYEHEVWCAAIEAGARVDQLDLTGWGSGLFFRLNHRTYIDPENKGLNHARRAWFRCLFLHCFEFPLMGFFYI